MGSGLWFKSPAIIVELSISAFNCQFLLNVFWGSVIRL